MNFLVLIRYFIEFILFKIIFFLLSFLSKNIASSIVSNIFMFLGKVSNYNKIAKENCKFVFSDFDDKEILKIIDKSWKNLGKNFYELSYLKKLINDENAIKIIWFRKT